MEVVVTTGAIRCAMLQSSHHHPQSNCQLFTGWLPFQLSNQRFRGTEFFSPVNGKLVLTKLYDCAVEEIY